MSRSSRPNLIFDPEVEKTAKQNRKRTKEQKIISAETLRFGQTEPIANSATTSDSETDIKMDGADRNLNPGQNPNNPYMWELTGHSEDDPPTPIQLPETENQIEIKLAFLNVLPKFHGRSTEDPYNFLSEFIKICKVQKRPSTVTEDQFKLVAFPFSLTGAANQWFSSLPPNSIATWAELKILFLENYFPATRTDALKKEITSIKQEYDEPLSMFWLRFRKLVDSCPNHRMTEGQLLQCFYQGMTSSNKDLVNSSSSGGFSHLRVNEAREIIKRLVNSKKEYDQQEVRILKKVAQTSTSEKDEIKERMERMEKMLSKVVDKVASVQEGPCDTCGAVNHTTSQCILTMGEIPVQANAMGNFNERQQKGPYTQNFNPRYRDHPNFQWREQGPPPQQPQHYQRPYVPPMQREGPSFPQPQQGGHDKSLNEKMDMLMDMMVKQSKKTESTLEEHTRQITHLSNSMNELRMNQHGLPSQVQLNPHETVNQVTLRSEEEFGVLPLKSVSKEVKEFTDGGSGLAKPNPEAEIHNQVTEEKGDETTTTSEIP